MEKATRHATEKLRYPNVVKFCPHVNQVTLPFRGIEVTTQIEVPYWPQSVRI